MSRLIYLALIRSTDFNFYAVAFFNVLALSALALALMLTMRALRGRSVLADAFFPLVLLHWSQVDNLIWGFQIHFVVSVVLSCTLLAIILRCEDRLRLRTALLFSLCAMALGLCGMYGLAYLPAAACWMLIAGVRQWRCGPASSRWKGLVIAALATAPLALVGFVFVGFEKSSPFPNPGVLASLSTSLEFLSGGMGRAAKEFWPLSGAVALAVCAAVGWCCWRALRDRPTERLRAAGLLCFLAGVLLLALGIGWGRSCGGPGSGYQLRYLTLAAPLFCLAFAVCGLYTGGLLRLRLERILLVAACVLWGVNAHKGINFAFEFNDGLKKLSQDLHAGLPTDSLAVRYSEQWARMQPELFQPILQSFRRAFSGLSSGRAYQPEDLSIRVCPLVPIERGAPIDWVRLDVGGKFVERFTLDGNATLSRLDVELAERQRIACPGQLVWQLLREGQERPVAKGVVELARVEIEPYLSIDLPAIAVRGTTQYSLTLRFAGDASGHTFLAVPRYPRKPAAPHAGSPSGEEWNCVAAARGFLYLRDSDSRTASRDAGAGCRAD